MSKSSRKCGQGAGGAGRGQGVQSRPLPSSVSAKLEAEPIRLSVSALPSARSWQSRELPSARGQRQVTPTPCSLGPQEARPQGGALLLSRASCPHTEGSRAR